jgi:hypothetical protein
MKKNKQIKVEKFLENQILDKNNKTMNMIVLPIDSNSYILFGKYAALKKDNHYRLLIDDNDQEKIFSTLKTAVTWCVFKELKKAMECKNIEQLDFKLSSLEIDLLQKSKILNSTKDDRFRDIYVTKIEEDNLKKKILLKQLNRYINISKEWQTKKFNIANLARKDKY